MFRSGEKGVGGAANHGRRVRGVLQFRGEGYLEWCRSGEKGTGVEGHGIE